MRRQRGPGRPPEHSPEKLQQACFLAEQGMTSYEIAKSLGVAVSTLYVWLNQFPEYQEALNKARSKADDRVEAALYLRASGYEQEVEKVFANGTRLKVIEHVQPDTTAQIFWLKNRKRLEWSDRREHELIVPVTDGEVSEDNPRQLALAMLALVSEAAHNPPPTHAGPMIEATAQVEEPETDEEEFDPDFDE